MNEHDKIELKPGMRIRLSELGRKRSPRMKIHTGQIVSRSDGGDSVRILLDGSKGPITVHQSYVEPQ